MSVALISGLQLKPTNTEFSSLSQIKNAVKTAADSRRWRKITITQTLILDFSNMSLHILKLNC